METSGVLSRLILLYPEGFGKKLLGNRKLPNFPKNSGTNQVLQCLKNGSPNKRFKTDSQRVAFPPCVDFSDLGGVQKHRIALLTT
ncbi:hypothetical protein D8T40_22420 [Vibrio vulnificus]|nr:hypothetical protein D8T40_22420 [Vibrio vulnificus]